MQMLREHTVDWRAISSAAARNLIKSFVVWYFATMSLIMSLAPHARRSN